MRVPLFSPSKAYLYREPFEAAVRDFINEVRRADRVVTMNLPKFQHVVDVTKRNKPVSAFPAFLLAVRQTAWQAPASLFLSKAEREGFDKSRGYSTQEQRVLMGTDISNPISVGNTMSILQHWKVDCNSPVLQQFLGKEWEKYQSSPLPRHYSL